MNAYSYISNAHPAYIEQLYQDYQNEPTSVDTSWYKFFEGFEFALQNYHTNGSSNGVATAAAPAVDGQTLLKELKVYQLINAYRQKAHLESKTNPIRQRRDRGAHIKLSDVGLTEADLSQTFAIGSELGLGTTSLQNIVDRLQKVYLGPLGFEYAYVTDPAAKKWLQERIEGQGNSFQFDIEQKKHILSKLNETVVFEKFLHTKYIGHKRFSLEGGESTIPAIDALINTAVKFGVEEVVIGMAHRGRLNVLVNIMGKTYEQIFNEFEGNIPADLTMGDGDVKYHLGYVSQVETTGGKKVYLNLAPNPSHLESVNPVVAGWARAQADVIYDSDYDKILPILIHGDAAIAGQGVVYEYAQMSKLDGYYTGGTIHFVINNQIGFTTDFDDARSADYCTSIASIVKAPVIHVNGDDVEAVVFAAQLAAEYRQKFNSDIYIDMVCYRKHGHNENDEPKFTQPHLYEIIANHPDPKDIYSKKLMDRGDVEAELAQRMNEEFWQMLQERLDEVRQNPLPYEFQAPEKAWHALRRSVRSDFDESPITGISKEWINKIVDGLVKVPDGFNTLRKVKKLLERRRKTMKDNKSLDWAAGELMAYASILLEGNNVRMSGQDVKRGTFSHRHAILTDENTTEQYNRLNFIDEKQGEFLIYNSFLSEFAVLGFEFGYSMASPDTLTIWEAQFGDFANGAQTIIDQYVLSSESKWQRMSGLVMLLPHGYTGQGPEHSSARLERFLQGCGEHNVCVVNITTPANFFHAIRRQQHRPFRKPLIVMSPKSLLRHPKCTSSIFDIVGDTKFQEILDDPFVKNKKKVKKVILCSGKIYYDLAEKQTEEDRQDVAIIRLEQLYPIARIQLDKVLAQYPKKAKLVWVQEEPANMGAWWHILYRLRDLDIDFVARKNSASPATGFKKVHQIEQAKIVEAAFKI